MNTSNPSTPPTHACQPNMMLSSSPIKKHEKAEALLMTLANSQHLLAEQVVTIENKINATKQTLETQHQIHMACVGVKKHQLDVAKQQHAQVAKTRKAIKRSKRNQSRALTMIADFKTQHAKNIEQLADLKQAISSTHANLIAVLQASTIVF